MAKKNNTVEALSNFAIESAFGLSSGVMKNHHSSEPIKVQLKGLLGTQSQYTEKEDKLAESMNKPNPQRVEVAMLNPDEDTLRVEFSWKIARDIDRMNVTMTNMPEMVDALKVMHEAYKKKGGYQVLAERYALQITKGEPLFRNKYGLELGVKVKSSLGGEFIFVNKQKSDDFDTFVEHVKRGLEGEFVVFDIEMTSKLGHGQQVYPSQEMEMNSSKGAVSRVLDKDADGNAMMHPWKLGNAIRTIDTWYPDYEEIGKPIPVEPYGAHLRSMMAYRLKNKVSYYGYQKQVLDYVTNGKVDGVVKVIEDDTALDDIQDIHYFMAMLCRGGVLGMTEKKDNG